MAKKKAPRTKTPADAPALSSLHEGPSALHLSYIAEPLRALAVPIESVTPDPKNARKHDAENIGAIGASLKRYGLVKPLVVDRATGTIVAGNGTWEAAKQLKWTHVAVVYVEHSASERTGYAIADNRTAELATWDDALLSELLAEVRSAATDDDRELLDALALSELEMQVVGQQTTSEVAPERFQVTINCKDSDAAGELYARLKGEGYDVRSSTIRHAK